MAKWSTHWTLSRDWGFKSCCSPLAAHCFTNTEEITSTAPVYLTEPRKFYKPTHQLRSSCDTSILCFTSVCMCLLGQKSFSYAALYVWNSLRFKIRLSNTLTSFKSSLKSELFSLLLTVRRCISLISLCFGSLLCNGLCAPISDLIFFP